MNKRITASVSLDLDNYWAYLKAHGDEAWKSHPSFLETAGPRILQFFQEIAVQPTIFVVGQDLQSTACAEIVCSMAAAGFEIGNHSFNHQPNFHSLQLHEIKEEVRRCEDLITELVGEKPVGFRGPSFQVSDRIVEVLVEFGYIYDASSYPTSIAPLARAYHLAHSRLTAEEKRKQKHLFGGFSNAFSTLKQSHWTVSNGSITEIPVTTMPVSRLPIHFTYLNYIADLSETLAMAYFQTAMTLLKISKLPASFLLHPTDFLGAEDKPIPHFLPGMKRSYPRKLTFLKKLFGVMNQHYRLSGMKSSLSER